MNEKRHENTIQPSDLFQLQFIHEGMLSPDGRQVVYAVAHVDPQEEKEYVTLWLLSLEGGTSRQLTSGRWRDTNPRWSPDGRLIAFLSDRDEQPQLYVIPIDGGEARQVTELKQGAGTGPVWSPDGRRLAFTAPPGEPPSGTTAPYRIDRRVYRFDDVGYLDHTAQDIFVVSLDSGEVTRVTDDRCLNHDPQWSPDGNKLLYLASLHPEASRYHPRVMVADLDGEIREIVGAWGFGVAAAWMPDSAHITFIGQPHGRRIGTKNELWVIDTAGGNPESRTGDLQFGVGGGLQADMPVSVAKKPRIVISPTNNLAYVQVQVGGTVQIFEISLTGVEAWRPVITGERSCIPMDLQGNQLLYLVSETNNPTDLHISSPDGTDEQRLTAINQELLMDRTLPRVEHLSFHGTDGTPVEGWIMLPTEGTAPYPTILYIHGGPHSGFGHIFSFDFQMLAGAGYAVLFINQRGSTGYGDRFATQIIGDWGNLDYTDLIAGVDDVIERGLADGERLGCCGLSGGGNLSCWIVGQTDRFKAAVPENPVTNWVSFYGVSDIGTWFAVEELGGRPHEIPEVYRRCSPITYAHRCTTPTLLVQGENDHRCPPEQSEQFYSVLKANGCTVEMLRLPGCFHGGSLRGTPQARRVQNEALLDWMDRFVLGEEPEQR